MEYIALGRSNLLVSRTAFGAYGLQQLDSDEAAAILVQKAYDGGINFFDTARSKPGSETRLGYAIHTIRQNVILASKTTATTPAQIRLDIEESLTALQTDYIDLYQIEQNTFVPRQDSADDIYNTLSTLKKSGKIRHIGFIADTAEQAEEALETNLYETIQMPFNMLSADLSAKIVKRCALHDIGFIAMQPLCGGVIRNIPLAYGFLRQYENIVPLWGIRTEEELHQILYFEAHPPVVDDKFMQEAALARSFFS